MEWLGKALEGLLQLWERGKTLLWALAIACAGVIAILLGGAFLGIAGTAAALDSYGLPLVVGAVVFGILAALKMIEGRGRPNVHIIPNNHQSLWGQHSQADGRITTQLSFHMQVTNLTDRFITLSELRLSRPWTRARVIANVLATRHPEQNVFGGYLIRPRAISEASATLILDGAVGRHGMPMKAIIRVSDQFGRWPRA